MITPQECLFSTDSAHFDCIPTNVSHPYPHVSKCFDHPFNAQTLKTYNHLASQHYNHSELPYLIAQSTSFILKKQYRHSSKTASYAQVFSSAKVYEIINPEIEPNNNDKLYELQKMFDLSQTIEEMI